MSLFLGHVLSLKAPTKSVSSAYRIQDQNLSMASQCCGSGHQLFYLSRILSFEEHFCLQFFEIPLALSNITTTSSHHRLCCHNSHHRGSVLSLSCVSLWPHGLQHPRPPCPLLTPGACSTHVCWVGDVIQPSRPLPSPYSLAFNLSQHEGLFQWVSSSHQVAKVLEFQLQHKSFQWIFRTDFL